jgi:hypothetical protein
MDSNSDKKDIDNGEKGLRDYQKDTDADHTEYTNAQRVNKGDAVVDKDGGNAKNDDDTSAESNETCVDAGSRDTRIPSTSSPPSLQRHVRPSLYHVDLSTTYFQCRHYSIGSMAFKTNRWLSTRGNYLAHNMSTEVPQKGPSVNDQSLNHNRSLSSSSSSSLSSSSSSLSSSLSSSPSPSRQPFDDPEATNPAPLSPGSHSLWTEKAFYLASSCLNETYGYGMLQNCTMEVATYTCDGDGQGHIEGPYIVPSDVLKELWRGSNIATDSTIMDTNYTNMAMKSENGNGNNDDDDDDGGADDQHGEAAIHTHPAGAGLAYESPLHRWWRRTLTARTHTHIHT